MSDGALSVSLGFNQFRKHEEFSRERPDRHLLQRFWRSEILETVHANRAVTVKCLLSYRYPGTVM